MHKEDEGGRKREDKEENKIKQQQPFLNNVKGFFILLFAHVKSRYYVEHSQG